MARRECDPVDLEPAPERRPIPWTSDRDQLTEFLARIGEVRCDHCNAPAILLQAFDRDDATPWYRFLCARDLERVRTTGHPFLLHGKTAGRYTQRSPVDDEGTWALWDEFDERWILQRESW